MKTQLTLAFSLIVSFCFSQVSDNISIKLKDYHTSQLTQVISTNNEQYLISADNSGKVLMFDTENYSYLKTLREASNIPIHSMKLVRNDSLLLLNQRYEFSEGKTDSLIGVRIYDGKVVFKQNIKGSFIDKQNDVIIGKSKNQYLHIIEVFDKNFKKITTTYANNHVKIAATPRNPFTVAFVENKIDGSQNLKVIDTKTAKELINLSVPESLPIIHLFYDKETDELYSINADIENKKIHIYNLSNNKQYLNPVFSEENPFGKFVNVNATSLESDYKIVLSSKGTIPYNPIIITKKKNKFSSEVPHNENGVSHGLYLSSKNEYVFFEPFNTSFSSTNTFSVFDNISKTIKNRYPNESVKFYSGTFLPYNNWMVKGNELNQQFITTFEHQIKYFETGTFNNRFGTLDFSNYLEANHQAFDFTKTNFDINELTGVYPFYGYKKLGEYENDYGFYKYDFIQDEVTKIANDNSNYRTIIDYNNDQNLLLLSLKPYGNGGYTEPQEFTLIKDNKEKTLSGKYKFGKISNNGEFILTINSNNLAQIHETKTQKVVFEEPLTDGRFELFSVYDNGFVIGNSYYLIDMNKCNRESLIIEYKPETSEFNSQKFDCLYVTDVSYSKDKMAMVADGFGIIINDETKTYMSSEFPERVSLNDDATKLMVSFNNGKISILDTETLQELGVMLHPNKNTHAFIDREGHFFTNSDPNNFFIASKNNQTIDITNIEDHFFKPEKVLSLFGKPNLQYVNTLKKALALRGQAEKNTTQNTPKTTQKSSDPDELYVLSIGVSEYEQTDYNLTFADKDALDIAKIYGKLSEEDMLKYKSKFFGHQYALSNTYPFPKRTLNKYTKLFESIGDLYAVNSDRTLWLEHKQDKFFLWDFKEQTTSEFNFPKEFKFPSYSSNKIVFINPDNSSFYIKDENSTYYQYHFESGSFNKVTLPFKTSSEPQPIKNNHWANFTYRYNGKNNEGILEVSQPNSTEIDTLKFNLDIIEYFEGNAKKLDTIDAFVPTFKNISSNGNYLVYSLNNSLFLVDLTNKNPIPQKINIETSIDYNTEVSISNSGDRFSLLERYSNQFRYRIKTYKISGIPIQTRVLMRSINGFSLYNNKPVWIKSSEPLVNEELFNADELLANHKPHSFTKTHIKHLTNKEATSENIRTSLLELSQKANNNDQIIIFLAGHGVLDKKLNYLFSPHDMDFNNVTKNGVSLNTIIESLKKCKSNNILLLMDSCHSGNTLDMETSGVEVVHDSGNPNERGSKSRKTNKNSKFKVSEVISTLFQDFLSTSRITIISASAGEDVAYENKELGNGAFTSAYIKLLKKELKGNGFIIDKSNLNKTIPLTTENIEELLKDVMVITNGKQVPDLREMNTSSNLKMW
ncbi:hypothetical protein N1F78_07140 [Seonamhaeicola sp. MEBiC1930]|uniref:caspase family protein n=1 Tax=Seonamhaeicola sp. MEBiC01930 TaxID=2976768 RepID=UPI00324D4EE9